MEFHRTAYLGSLIDATLLSAYQEKAPPSEAGRVPPVGASPEAARKAGENISGRVLSATLNFPSVGVIGSSGVSLRARRGLSSLTSMLDHIRNNTKWEHLNVAWLGEVDGLDDPNYLTPEQCTEFEKLLGPKNVPVWLDGSSKLWREYAEKILWPTLHYSHNTSDLALEQAISQSSFGWQPYIELNERFAETIISNYKKGDIIMVHDMYLLLLPSILRKKLPEALIGLYVYTPFPSSELFRGLPQRSELLNGMLGSTIIGFQSAQYVKHFISAATRLTGIESIDSKLLYDGRFVACIDVPFGLNTQAVLDKCSSPDVQVIAKEIKAIYRDKLLIVGRDKLDSTQGILQKLRAFLVLLELYPQWRGQVVFVQITTLTWQFSARLEQEMSQLISYINGKFGDMNYSPIVHFSQHMEQDEYFALLKIADVGFFTPIREGASFAAVEYVLCQNCRSDQHEGGKAIGASMVLSEFMGITGLMAQGGTPVNPFDSLQVSFMLNQALTVSQMATKSANDAEIYKAARKHYDVSAFVTEILSHLVLHDLKHENQHYTPEANRSQMAECSKKASKKLILLDYDGTLTPIVRDPAAAVPSDRLKKVLKELSDRSDTSVWIISGRDMKFLDKHLSEFKINLSAEHGCYVKYADKGPDASWEDLVSQIDMSWMKVVLDVLQSYTERTEGSSIERKNSAITWHYRRSDPIFGAFQASHLRAYLELTVAKNYPIDVMAGKANVEIRPRLFNKGEIVRNIFKAAREEGNCAEFVLCIGDDTTDEDMFRVLSDQTKQTGMYPVIVGPATKLTIARSHVNTVDNVHELLEAVCV